MCVGSSQPELAYRLCAAQHCRLYSELECKFLQCPSILTRTLHGAGPPVLAERTFVGSKTGTLGQVLLRAVQSQLLSLSVVGNRIVGSIVGSLHSTFEMMNLKTLPMAQPSTVPAGASCRRHGPAVIARRASSQGCTTSQSSSTFSLSFANMSVLMRRRRTVRRSKADHADELGGRPRV